MHPIPDDWHEDFFDGLWQEVQRQTFSATDNAEIADAVLGILQLPDGARLLDVPCGDGRTALEFAARGLATTGVERNAQMLERARAAAAGRGLHINWREQDMWAFDAGRGFDAAVCLWTSLGYGSREQDQAFLEAVSRSLGDEGLFLLETHVYETLLPAFEERVLRWAGDILVTEEREFDVEEGRLCTAWTFAREGTMERRRSKMQLYTVPELDAMLVRAGLQPVASWGGFELDAFEVGSPILVHLARKA